MQTEEVPLTRLFTAARGDSRFTKAYGSLHPGEYPVYSAAVQPLTYIDSFDFDGEFLTWNTNGFGGYVTVLRGKFSLNGDRGILLPIRDDIDINYVAAVLQRTLRSAAIGRRGDRGANEFTKVSLDTVRKASVIMPMAASDSELFDVDRQRLIAGEIDRIRGLQQVIRSRRAAMSDMRIKLKQPEHLCHLAVGKVFDLDQTTNSSNLTKAFVNRNQGSIPVYSASGDEEQVGYGRIVDNLPGVKYFSDCLTWNIDGSVGKAIYRSGRFSLSEKVVPLLLREEWQGKIDLEYAKYALEERALENGFNYSHKAGKSRIKDIVLSFPTCMSSPDLPDLSLQTQIAGEFRNAVRFQREVLAKFASLGELDVVPSALIRSQ